MIPSRGQTFKGSYRPWKMLSMGNWIGGALLLSLWGGSGWLGRRWASSIGAPWWFAVFLAQILGGAAVFIAIWLFAGRYKDPFEIAAVGLAVAVFHASAIAYMMGKEPSDWNKA